MTANIRTTQRTVSAMQRFAVSQKNRTGAITISPFSLSLPYRTENRRFSALSCTKTGDTQPKLSAACFCCPILLGRCRICSFLKLLSYRHTPDQDPFSPWSYTTRKFFRFPFRKPPGLRSWWKLCGTPEQRFSAGQILSGI